MVLTQQTLRMEQATWFEGPTALHCYLVGSDGEKTVCPAEDRALLLRGLFQATIRTRAEEGADLPQHIAAAEASLMAVMKPPPAEYRQGIRYAVVPLLAALIGAPGS